MGAILYVVDDDFKAEREFGYIPDHILEPIVEKSKELRFKCLSYVLGYENTCFNSEQMEEIEKELTILGGYFREDNIKEILKKIRVAIEFAKKDPPLYLLFEGD